MAQNSCDGQPVADIALVRDQLQSPVALWLSGGGSNDCDGTLVAWDWTIDGLPLASGETVPALIADPGQHTIGLTVTDDAGNQSAASVTIEVLEAFCPIMPLALETSLLAGAAIDQSFNKIPLDTGPGNFSELTWTGDNDEATLSVSLAQPGDSHTYVNPDDPADELLNIGDWVQGKQGVTNASAVRAALDALLGEVIVIPIHDQSRAHGSAFDFHVADFVQIELTAYRLSGQGFLSFIYRGPAPCYDPDFEGDFRFETPEDTPLDIELPAELAGATLWIGPQNGAVTGAAPSLNYAPAPDFFGRDRFVLLQAQELETVIIDVLPVVDPPAADPQSVTTPEDTPLAITLSGTPGEGGALSFALTSSPANGVLTGTPPDLSYTPSADFNGTDSFAFAVTEDGLSSAPATVSITVTPVNDPPVADAQSVSAIEDQPLAITLSGSDVDGDPLTFVIDQPPANGVLTGTAPDLVYTPTADFFGSDNFIFSASDGALQSDPVTVAITVSPENDPPVAMGQSISTDEDQAVAVTLSGSDVEGDALSFAVAAAPANGTLSGTPPDLTYTPFLDFNGADSFQFVANDGQADSAPATVTITVNPVNDPPLASADPVTLDEDSSASILISASDADGDPLSYLVATPPANGAVTGTGPDFTYSPNPDFNGTDSVTFAVSDGSVQSDPVVVVITVAPVNDEPTADGQSVETDEDQSVAITLTGSDIDGDALSYAIVAAPVNGALSGTAPDLSYQPDPGFVGIDTFTFVANDGTVDSPAATVTIQVNAVNVPPIADDQSLTLAEDTQVAVTLTGSDADGDPLTFSVVAGPASGTLSGSPPDLSYTPAADFNGADGFQFVANDGEADSAAATVTLTVTPVNDAPTISPGSAVTDEDTPVVITVAAGDVDGDPLTFSVVTPPASGALTGSGPDFTYQPDPDFNGGDSFSVSVSDGTVESGPAAIAITVNPVNDAPVALAQSLLADGPIAVTLSGTDVDGDALTFQVTAPPANGTLSSDPPALTYTPDGAFTGIDTFDFVANDGTVVSAPARITIDVSANNAPQITSSPPLDGAEGEPYSYQVTATDADGDPLTFSLPLAPPGMSIDAAGGLIGWTPGADTLGAVEVTVRVEDPRGASDEQQWVITVPGSPVNRTYLGTDFWLSFGGNTIDRGQPAASVSIAAPDGASGNVQVPGLALDIPFTVVAGGLERITLPSTVFAGSDGTVKDNGVHVTSDAPVTVTLYNEKEYSTDSAQVFPTAVLPQDYTVAAFNGLGWTMMYLVATEDDTTVIVTPSPGLPSMRGNGVPNQSTFTLTLNRGEVYHSVPGNSDSRNYLTGTTLRASKPIAVFGGSLCAFVPDEVYACDHIIEQVPGDRHAASRFLTVPFATRFGGDYFRFVAIEDATRVEVNDVQIAVLDAGEFADRIIDGHAEITASRPIYAVQLATGSDFDVAQRQDDNADPFMVILPPTTAYLDEYIFATAPNERMVSHHVNVVIPAAAATSLVLDGAPVDTSGFGPIRDTGYVGGSVAVAYGTHTISADDRFGLTIYGWGPFESYGSNGNAVLGTLPPVDRLIVTPAAQTQTVGANACVEVTAKNPLDYAVPFVAVDIVVSGARTIEETIFTDPTGSATYCYVGIAAGNEVMTLTSGPAFATADVSWTPLPAGTPSAPIIVSLPPLTLNETTHSYDVDAIDANGDPISYGLLQGPAGISIDPSTGLLTWTPPVPADRQPTRHSITVTATDPGGAQGVQHYELLVNYAPVFVSITPEESETASPQLTIEVAGGDPRANQIAILEAPPRANVLDDNRANTWRFSTAISNPIDGDPFHIREAMEAFNPFCRAPLVDPPELAATQVWESNEGMHLVVADALIDTDGNGVVNSADDLYLVGVSPNLTVLNAATGALHWSVSWAAVIEVVPAIADLDGDGTPEVLAADDAPDGSRRLYAYDNQGTLLWESAAPVLPGDYAATRTAIEVVDLDGDGTVEIVVGPTVLDPAGAVLWQFPTVVGGAVTEAFPWIADLDGDGSLEVLFGDEVRNAAGTLRWTTAAALGQSGTIAQFVVSDLDQDGQRDVIASVFDGLGHALWVFERDGQVKWGPLPLSDASLPAVADFDRDGGLEIYVPNDGLRVDATGQILGTDDAAVDQDYFRVAIADLNDDGLYEVLRLRNTNSLQIVDLLSGLVWSDDAGYFEPESRYGGIVIADADRDGHVELLVGGNLSSSKWVQLAQPRASEWRDGPLSQPSYGLSAAGDEVGIAMLARDRAAQPDLWIGKLRASQAGGQYQLSVRVTNRGPAAAATPTTVEFYRGDPELPGASLLGSVALGPMGANRSIPVTLGNLTRLQVSGDIVARLVTTEQECEVRNNSVATPVYELEVFDSPTRRDRLLFLPGLLEAERAEFFSSTPPSQVAVGSTYAYDPVVNEMNIGDALRFDLLGAVPAGLVLNPETGQIRWTPTAADLGSYSFSLRYRDLSNLSRSQGVSITVVATSNDAPVITSTPVIVAAFDTPYAYDVEATDPDGDPIVFALQTAPTGMTIDAASGLIQWTPTSADAGQHPVSVSASDGQGGQAVQDYQVTVGATLNSPPVIEALPSDQAKQSKLYRDFIIASDPDGDPLTFTKLDGPSGLSINATTGEVSYYPPTSFSGLTTVVFEVSDGTYTVEDSWMITVAPRLQPLGVTIELSTEAAVPDELVQVTVAAVSAAGPYTLALTMDGADVPLDAQGQATVSAGQPGLRAFVATAVDQAETAQAQAELLVVDPNDSVPPVVAITAPTEGAVVTAPTPMLGDVIEDNLAFWRVVLKQTGTHAGEQEIARASTTGTGIALGTLDPTLLHNGAYALVLEATDFGGNVVTDSIGVLIEGNMKVGHFSITLEDVSIDMVGIPLQVTRTYDTRQRGENLDFGYGWSVDYQNLRLQESRAPGRSWRIDEEGGSFGQTCARPNGSNYVTVTLPGGDAQRFLARAIPECKSNLEFVNDPFWELGFEPVGNTTATLEQNSYGLLRVIDGHLVDLGAPDEPVDPRFYRLTTQQGMIFELDEGFGIRLIVDNNGNQVSYSDFGIVHSAGKRLDFVRDGQGRITDIIVPNGEILSYSYDLNGDLVAFTDEDNRTADYTYQAGHYLLDVENLKGHRVSTQEYDADGRLVAIVDGGNKRIELTHDITGRTEQVRDRLGNLTVYSYDERGNVTSETNALGETILRTYDAEDNQLTETDPLGNTTTWTYDSRGNRLTEENPAGEVTTFAYDTRSQVLTQTDPLGNVVITNEYDLNGNISRSTDALGNTTEFVIGSLGQSLGLLFRITDAAGSETSYDYDAGGNRIKETDPDGHVTEWSYDENNNVISETRRRINQANQVEVAVTSYVNDVKGRRIATIDALGNVSTTQYDFEGNVTKEIDANGNAISYSFDTFGRLIIQSYPDFTSETKTYDAEGRVTMERNRLNRQTRMSYDAAGRLTETIYPDATATLTDNPRTTNEYDAAGRLTATIDERGNRTEYEYDSAGRRTLVRDALLRETTFVYDARGLRTAMTDANGHTTKFVYDAAGRLIETLHPDLTPADDSDNPRTFMGYDALGRKTYATDELGRTTQFEYDGRGNLTAVIDALGQRTEYGYDGHGNKISQTDARGRVTRWEYDRLGRVISRTLPLGQTETHGYDPAGNQVIKTDFNGNTTEYRYDSNNRLIETIFDDFSTRTQTYLANGLVDTVTDQRGVTDYDYDERDRLIGITYPNGQIVEYQYDQAGNRVALITANQSVVYGFDALNRMQSVTDDTGSTTYAYDLVGNRARIDYPNGTATAYGYDPRNRLTRMDHLGPIGNNLLGLSYVLNENGTRAQILEDTGRQTTYTYDALNRLTREAVVDPNRIDRTSTWVYDPVGNRLSQDDDGVLTSYTYNANDHLLTETTGVDVTSYVYDANGNTRQKRVNGVTEATYQYDFEDRMVQADTGAVVVSYTYDENGIRQSQNVDGAITDFVVDPNQTYAQVIEELDGLTGSSLVIYTHGDDLIAQQRIVEGATGFYHYDGLGSTRLLTDQAGAAVNSYVFKAFGETEDEAVLLSNLYLFTGEQFDPNAGFYYLRARYYNHAVGRFHTMDTFLGIDGKPATLHKYVFANASPTLFVDPSGQLGLISVAPNITLSFPVRIGSANATLTAGAKVAAEIAFEFATGIPVMTSPRGIFKAIKSFKDAVGKLGEDALKKMEAGRDFEKTVRKLFDLGKNTVCYKDGIPAKRPGCFIPDLNVNGAGRFVEVKTSMGAVKKKQFQEFIKISQNSGNPLGMVFLKKPTAADVAKLEKWALEVVDPSEQILMKIVHVLD